jgi:hypothetical protein
MTTSMTPTLFLIGSNMVERTRSSSTIAAKGPSETCPHHATRAAL